jgi:hypothetical protein
MALPTDRTHGRWPYLAAAAAPIATAVVVARRDQLGEDLRWALWTMPPALLWHQTEEWFWPGGFLPWFNEEVLGSDDAEFPITRSGALVITCVVGWGLMGAAAHGGMRRPSLAASALAFNAANGAMHVTMAARARRWNPGAATSAALFLPLGIAGLVAIARDPRGGARPVAIGVAVGIASGVGLLRGMRARLARR